MTSETTPLNQWSQDDLIKLAACIETVVELTKSPSYFEFSERIVPVIKAALSDVLWEERRLTDFKTSDL